MPKPTVEEIGARVRAEAQDHWDQGSTWYLLTIDGSANTAYLIQWVENVGWHLEHAGWVWAEKGTVGYGGVGLMNSSIIGNFLFKTTGGQTRAVSRRPLGTCERLRPSVQLQITRRAKHAAPCREAVRRG